MEEWNSVLITFTVHSLIKKVQTLKSEFILSGGQQSTPPRLLFWWKVSVLQPFWFWWSVPTPKNVPLQRKIKKSSSMPFSNSCHTIKITLYVKYGNSPKLGPKAIKWVLEAYFNLKINYRSSRMIGMTPIQYVAPFQ